MDGSRIHIRTILSGRGVSGAMEQWIVNGLVAALPDYRMAELFDARRDMLRAADVITLAVDVADDSAVGVLSSRWCGLPEGGAFLQIMAQFVGDRYQRSPIFRLSWRDHFTWVAASSGVFPDLMVLKTYNPVVCCGMRAFSRVRGATFYPDVTADRQDGDVVTADLAARVAAVIAPGHAFKAGSGVIPGAGVPTDLYPSLPRSTDQRVNRYFARTVRPGDRLLCMLSLPEARAVRSVLRAFGVRVGTDLPLARCGVTPVGKRSDGDG